ncbi:hypothetical protein ZWY2020_051834 [Hordeum vulgare]|nr:hypothetical protein ZWY2020_051834 [Hordeum vulgare]
MAALPLPAPADYPALRVTHPPLSESILPPLPHGRHHRPRKSFRLCPRCPPRPPPPAPPDDPALPVTAPPPSSARFGGGWFVVGGRIIGRRA